MSTIFLKRTSHFLTVYLSVLGERKDDKGAGGQAEEVSFQTMVYVPCLSHFLLFLVLVIAVLLEGNFESGKTSFKAKNWSRAISLLSKVANDDPNYNEAQKILHIAKKQFATEKAAKWEIEFDKKYALDRSNEKGALQILKTIIRDSTPHPRTGTRESLRVFADHPFPSKTIAEATLRKAVRNRLLKQSNVGSMDLFLYDSFTSSFTGYRARWAHGQECKYSFERKPGDYRNHHFCFSPPDPISVKNDALFAAKPHPHKKLLFGVGFQSVMRRIQTQFVGANPSARILSLIRPDISKVTSILKDTPLAPYRVCAFRVKVLKKKGKDRPKNGPELGHSLTGRKIFWVVFTTSREVL